MDGGRNGSAPSLRRNAAWLLSSQAATAALQLAWAVLVARSLGQSDFGRYSFALALTQTVGILSDFGLNLFLIRELARDPGRRDRSVANALGFKLAATLLVWLVLSLIMVAGRHSAETIILVSLFAAANFILALSSTAICVFRASQDMRFEARAGVLFNLANLALSLAALVLRGPTIALAACYLSAAILQAAYLWVSYVRNWGVPRLSWDPGLMRSWSGSVLWLGLGGAFFLIYDRSPQIILQSMAGESQVGAYAAVYRLFLGLSILPTVAGNVLFPRMSHMLAEGQRPNLKRMLSQSLIILFISGTALTIALFLAAGPLVNLLYGRTYADAVPVMRILAWQLAFTFPGSVLGNLLIAAGEEKRYAFFSLVEMVIGVGVGLFMIPACGGAGAAAGILAGTVLVNMMIFLFLKSTYRWMFSGDQAQMGGS